MPAVLVIGSLVLLLALGLVFSGVVGAILIAIVALVHGWGVYLAWPRLTALERQMRLSVLMLVVALGVVSLLSGLR